MICIKPIFFKLIFLETLYLKLTRTFRTVTTHDSMRKQHGTRN